MPTREVVFKEKLGTLLKKARTSVNLSQEQVAAHFGVSQDTISKYERGKANISPYKLLEFSRLYEKPVTFFFMTNVSEIKVAPRNTL
jgi:transcriptional regulator with XRE-family HTH domain